jgi:hypothetical protein
MTASPCRSTNFKEANNMLKDQLAGTKFGVVQSRQHKTAKQLFELGRKCFMLMIEPQNVPFRTEREKREFDRGYYKTKITFIQTNPLVPAFFRDADAPRTKRVFRPRAA